MPFLPMSMAKGLLPDEHPQSAAAARSYAIGNADVVLLAGKGHEDTQEIDGIRRPFLDRTVAAEALAQRGAL